MMHTTDTADRGMAPGWALLMLSAGAAMPFAYGNNPVAAAAWAAPAMMLVALRKLPRGLALGLGALAMAAAQMLAWRGVLPFSGATYWGVTALVGLFFFLPYAVDRLLTPRLGDGAALFVFPLAWVVVEWAFGLAGFGSWGAIAYAHLDHPALLQLAALTGMGGIAFLNGLAASAVAALITREGGRRALRHAAACAALIALIWTGGALRLSAASTAPTVRMAGIVADNMAVFRDTWAPLSYGKTLGPEAAARARGAAAALQTRLLDATMAEARRGARIVAWSEGNALVFADQQAGFIARARTLAAREKIYLFMAMAVMTPGRPLAENVIVVVDPQGRVRDRYLKSHPTPGEASAAGDGRLRWIDTPYGRISWAICYDFDYPALIAQAGRAHADMLIDPAWDNRGMDPLHARMATLRAVETGAALLRVTNAGLSLATDGRGKMIAAVAPAPDATIRADLPVRGYRAAYAWTTALWPMAAAFALALLIWRRRRQGIRRTE